MKNVLKKNQIMITALAIMIAVAGYLNFAGTKLSDEELMKVSGQSVVTENGEETAREEDGLIEDYTSASLEISDEDMELAELDAITEETAGQVALQEIESLDTDDTTAAADYLSEDMAQNEVTESDTPGEAVFTSTSSVTSLSSAKLMKEQVLIVFVL